MATTSSNHARDRLKTMLGFDRVINHPDGGSVHVSVEDSGEAFVDVRVDYRGESWRCPITSHGVVDAIYPLGDGGRPYWLRNLLENMGFTEAKTS
jgi:hypothetical protein